MRGGGTLQHRYPQMAARTLGGLMLKITLALVVLGATLTATQAAHAQQFRFHLQEATIDDVHPAIRDAQITCRGLVQAYINRAKAYNGVADVLATKDGAPIAAAPGVVRAG